MFATIAAGYQVDEGVEAMADRPARQIVSAWFRANRDELRTILSLDEARQFCRGLQAG